MKADWCGFGAAEHERQTNAAIQKAEATTGTVGMEAVDAMKQTVGAKLMEEASELARRRWAQLLMQRGDPRSQALADYLGGPGDGASGEAVSQARARLQGRARTSSDPMVTALALMRPCTAGACANIEASQWSRLEPANLQAWSALLKNANDSRQVQVGYVLDRMAVEARYSRSYQREFTDMLLSLPMTETPGLQSEAEMQLIYGMAGAWQVMNFGPVIQACRAGLAQPGLAPRCEAVANTLWQQGDRLERGLAMALARLALPGRPEQRAAWERRARELEAVSEWEKGVFERFMARLIPDGKEPSSPCDLQPRAWQMLRESSGQSDWERARAEMRAAGVDEAALAAAWRRDAGRSALDAPLPPTSAASGAR